MQKLLPVHKICRASQNHPSSSPELIDFCFCVVNFLLLFKVLMASEFNEFQPTEYLLLHNEEDDHGGKVPPCKAVQVQQGEHSQREHGPVEERGALHCQDPEFRFAGRDNALPRRTEAFATFVEMSQPLLLLFPALPAPKLQLLLGSGHCLYGVSLDVEVNLLWEVSFQKVLLCLRNVLGVRHSYVMDGIEIVT